MKFSSIRYLMREGFRNLWQNRFMAIASIGVLVSCLLLTGGAYLIFANIDHIFDWVYEQNVVVVFADQECTEEEIIQLGEKIQSITNVAAVEHRSKDELLEEMADSMPGAIFEDLKEDNPLQDAFVVSFVDLSKFDATLMQLKEIPHVESVANNSDLADQLTKVRQIVLAVGGWIIGILLLVSLFIIANTIKLTVYNRRLEIYIMKSVGATRAFIRTPFVIEGIVLGLLSGMLSYGILYFVYDRLTGMLTFDNQSKILEYNTHRAPHIRDLPAFQLGQLKIIDDDLAGVGHLFPHDQFQQSAFSGSGCADNKHKLPFVDPDIDIFQGLGPVVVRLVNSFEFNQRITPFCRVRPNKVEYRRSSALFRLPPSTAMPPLHAAAALYVTRHRRRCFLIYSPHPFHLYHNPGGRQGASHNFFRLSGRRAGILHTSAMPKRCF